MIALNQNKVEKENGVMRVKQLAVREGRTSFQQAIVLQCLDIGRPVIDSKMENDVDLDDVKGGAKAAPEPRANRLRNRG